MPDRPTHPAVAAVAAALRGAGHPAEITELREPARTAAAAAAALGTDTGAIANSLVFSLAGTPVLLLVSGAHRVDTEKVGQRLGGRLTRADADTVRAATGQPIGGVAPVGHPAQLRTLIDEQLADYPEVWAAAGHPHTVFRTTYGQLLDLTGATPLRVD